MILEDMFALFALGIISFASLMLITLHFHANVRLARRSAKVIVKKPTVSLVFEAEDRAAITAVLGRVYKDTHRSYTARLILLVRTKKLLAYAQRQAKEFPDSAKTLSVIQLQRGGLLPIQDFTKAVRGSIVVLLGKHLPTDRHVRTITRSLQSKKTNVVMGSLLMRPDRSILSAMQSIGLILETHLSWLPAQMKRQPLIGMRVTYLRRILKKQSAPMTQDDIKTLSIADRTSVQYAPTLQAAEHIESYTAPALLIFGHLAYLLGSLVLLQYVGAGASLMTIIVVTIVPLLLCVLSISDTELDWRDKSRLISTVPLYLLLAPFWLLVTALPTYVAPLRRLRNA